jgi:hypothetical protein
VVGDRLVMHHHTLYTQQVTRLELKLLLDCRLLPNTPSSLTTTTITTMGKKGGAAEKKPAEKKGGKSETSDKAASKVSRIRSLALSLAHVICLLAVQGKDGLKAATAVNVRHILCEKQSRSNEAMAKIVRYILRVS